VYIIPVAEGTNSQNIINENTKIGLTEKDVVKVNAATNKVKAKTKKVKAKTKKTTKKAKAKTKKTTKKAKAKKTYKRTSSSYSSSGWSSDPTMDSIIRSGAHFRYSGRYHTGAEMEKYGTGDCWAMADYLVKKLNAAGYQAKVMYASGRGNHKHAFVLINGAWVRIPYGKYGISSSFGV